MFSADLNIPAGDGHFFGTTSNLKGVDGDDRALNVIDQASQVARQLLTLGVFGADAASRAWVVNISGHFKEQGKGKEFVDIKIGEA